VSLNITYQTTLPSLRNQAVSSADRPVCALTAALAAFIAGRKIGGILPAGSVSAAILDELARMGVPRERATTWAKAINRSGSERRLAIERSFNGFALDQYQLDTVEAMSPAGGVIAMGTGLGKTLTAICAVNDLSPKGQRLWIACPLNAMGSWLRHKAALLEWGWASVDIVSLDSLHKVHLASDGGAIILDECHLLGQTTARRTKAAHTVRLGFDVGIGLTGTFLHGGVEKTLSMMDLAVPGSALFASRWGAGEYYACLVRKDIGGRKLTALERPTGIAKERFFSFVHRIVHQVNKADAAVCAAIGLSGQHLHTIKLGEPWRSLEDLAVDLIQAALAAGEEMPNAQSIAHTLCAMDAETKIGWLVDRIRDEAIVCFAQYTATLDAAAAALTEEGITFDRIDGTTSAADRLVVRDKFMDGTIRVVLAQVVAGGIGMDGLQTRTPYSACLDHCWRPDAYAQMLARTHRRGQIEDCHHFDFVSNHLQLRVVERIRAGEVFDRECAEWASLRHTIDISALPA